MATRSRSPPRRSSTIMGRRAGTVKARKARARLVLLTAEPADIPPSTNARKTSCATGSVDPSSTGAAPQMTPFAAAPSV
jgi:hypothetical protein